MSKQDFTHAWLHKIAQAKNLFELDLIEREMNMTRYYGPARANLSAKYLDLETKQGDWIEGGRIA